MKNISTFENFKSSPVIDIKDILLKANKYDIQFNDRPSTKGDKISIIGKSIDDVFEIYDCVHTWLDLKNITYKVATNKRVEHPDYEQSKKLMTIYVPDDMDKFDLMLRLEILLKNYKGWNDIKTPFKGYKHYSGGIFFRNDRDTAGNYIAAKNA